MNIIDKTSTIPASNYGRGRSHVIDQITFHHIVGDAPAALARFQIDGEQVSSTYIIGSNGQIYAAVAEGNTPYTDANGLSNSRAITIEHAGGIASVPYTDAMYRASAELVADIKRRHNITRFMRHRDVSDTPTACPGALDVERILREAIQGGKIVMTDDQINDWISKTHYIAFGKPASAAIFDDWRKVLKNNPIDGSLSILAGIDSNAGALKNKPAGFVPLGKEVYIKG